MTVNKVLIDGNYYMITNRALCQPAVVVATSQKVKPEKHVAVNFTPLPLQLAPFALLCAPFKNPANASIIVSFSRQLFTIAPSPTAAL